MIDAKKTSYGRAVTTRLSYADAITRIKELLAEQGFGVLYEIDVTKTLREKVGASFRPYAIIGACNPQLAQRALAAEAQLGLLLPCNLVVQDLERKTIVSAIDTRKMMDLVGNPALAPVADAADLAMNRVLDNLAAR